MAENAENVSESLNNEKVHNKKIVSRKSRWSAKNSLRRTRKKHSKTRYYKSLKQLRYNRKTEDLCSAVQLFDICDMDWAPSASSAPLPPDIAEWQQHDQIAYWKSRAISLELENRMLQEHLRNVYAKTIEERAQYREVTRINDDVENTKGDKSEEKRYKKQKKKHDSPDQTETIKEESVESPRPVVVPREPEGKNRFEEMKKIYGEIAPKIMGMETTLQLNYERVIRQSKPPFWPSIPIRLSFE